MTPAQKLVRHHMSRDGGVDSLSSLIASMYQDGNVEAAILILSELLG